MFTNLLFLIIALLLTNIDPIGATELFSSSPAVAFFLALISYGILLILIYFQSLWFKKHRRVWRGKMLTMINLELIAYLSLFYFGFSAQRLFLEFGFSYTLPTLFGLTLFLGGLWLFHWSSFDTHTRIPSLLKSRTDYAWKQFRLIIPFAIPFLLFNLFIDLLSLIPGIDALNSFINSSYVFATLIVFGGAVIFMLSMMIFLPFFIQSIWQCQPLDNLELSERLEKICLKDHFEHGGIKSWAVMGDSLTAAIIGIIPRFRYVMFTKRLLNEMPPEMIEAVLVHEMGHSKRKHLLIYPFILMGMMVCASLFSYYFEDVAPIPVIFLGYLLIICLYFRLIFGFFSRLFERQADLHVFEVGINPEQMIGALNYIGNISNSHRVPSWHHFSIQERIDFLKSAIHDPRVISKHHRKVRFFVICYFLLLILSLIFLIKEGFL